MTKKKRGHPDIEEILARPWCYYCERDFDDLKILISHQKAKHFKCEQCGRRLNTAGGLSVHMNQVHKETLSGVENALPNRSDLSVEIFGMEGIPEDVVQQHNQRVAAQFQQDEADRRAASGNPPPGSGGAAGPKKPKTESAGDLKKRLAEFRAKKAAGETPGTTSGDATPVREAQSSPRSPAPFQNGSPNPQAPQPQNTTPQTQYPQSFGQAPQQIYDMSTYGPPPGAFPPHLPPGLPQSMQFPPQQVPGSQPVPPKHFTGAYPYHQQNAPGYPHTMSTGSPAQNMGSFAPPPGLPAPPGLPQRPSFNTPPSNVYQMHPGQYQGQQALGATSNIPPSQDPRVRQHQYNNPPSVGQVPTVTSSAVDDLIASVARETRASELAKNSAASDSPAPPATTEKKSKKEKGKEKQVKLIYSDNETSPEEKMAKLSRYAFDPAQRRDDNTTMGDAVHATVTGPVQD